MLRAEKGGSYSVDVALNYYSQWLVNSCGTYPSQVWTDLWSTYDRPVFRHYHSMLYSIPKVLEMLAKNKNSGLRQNEFFEDRAAENLATSIRTVKPILGFPQGEVELRFNVGTRGNGVDKPRWPENLMTQVVT
jgi:hypothetical protein